MKVKGIQRLFRHLCSTPWHVRKHFSRAALQHIEQAIQQSERMHSGQIRFVVEADLHPIDIMRGITPRARALALFSQLGIWDTAANNGVLIYVLLADRDVEIIADRGIHQFVGKQGWEEICQHIETQFRQGAFEQGVLQGIQHTGAHLQQHFPQHATHENELPDAPLVL